MSIIAALIVEPEEQAFVAGQLNGVATPRFCDNAAALGRLLSDGKVRAVLADVRDRTGMDTLPLLRHLRGRFPELPLVVCFRPTPAGLREALRDVPDFVKTVPNAGLILRGFEHIGLAIKRLLGGPRPPSAAETLLRRLVPLAPAALQPFLTICAMKSSPRLRVTAAAAWVRVPRRTLERHLTEAHWPGPAAIVGACTALHAAWWLDVQDWPTKQVIEEMQFCHPSALTRTLQRHFGCSVSRLRDHGGFDVLLRRFEQSLRQASPTPRARDAGYTMA